MAGKQHGKTIKERTIPLNRLEEELGTIDLSATDDSTLINAITLKDIADKISKQKNLLTARVMATSNQPLTAIGSPFVVDNITLANGDKVLLTNQTNPLENGYYTYNSAANELEQSFTQLEEFISFHSTLVFITEGLTHKGYLLSLGSANQVTQLGVDVLTFTAIARLVMAGNGLKDENGVLFGVIDPTSDTGLEITTNGFKLRHDQLPGAGGVPINSVPHPDIHSVTGNTVREVGQSGTLTINGMPFRRDATASSGGFSVNSYTTRRSNQMIINITAGNVAGLYNVVVNNNTLDSGDSGNGTFTVIGSPTLVSASDMPIAAGQTKTITLTGIGFLPLTAFNNAGESYTVGAKTYVNPTTYSLQITIPSSFISGDYNIQAINDHASTNAYDSGASGNDLIQVRNGNVDIVAIQGDPSLVGFGRDIEYGTTATVTATGSNLYPSAVISGVNVGVSTSGTSQSQTLVVDATSATSADIGLRDLTITDVVTGSSDVFNNAIAVNYPYLNAVTLMQNDFSNGVAAYTFNGNEIVKNATSTNEATDSIRSVFYLRKDFVPTSYYVAEFSFEYSANEICFDSTNGRFSVYLRNRQTGDRVKVLGGYNDNSFRVKTYIGTSQSATYQAGQSDSSSGWYKVTLQFGWATAQNQPFILGQSHITPGLYFYYSQTNDPNLVNILNLILNAQELEFELFMQKGTGKFRNVQLEGRRLT